MRAPLPMRAMKPWAAHSPWSSISVAVVLLSWPIYSAASPSDRLALLSFKSLITNDPSGALASWGNDSLHFCEWNGVRCSNRNSHRRRVTALDLQALDLAGSISPYLGNLTFLQRLHLSHNELDGPIPPELGLLPRLQHINLTFNSLDGGISVSLFYNCSRLQILDLRANKLQGRIPRNVSRCSHLQVLSLGTNMLEGEIPSDIGSVTKLLYLGLLDNYLTGSIPFELGNLTSLIHLNLRQNNLGGAVPPSIWNSSSLVTLDLQGNLLVGSLPRDLGMNLPQLKFFYVNYNRLTGPIPDSWHGAPGLVHVQLHGNGFTGTMPLSFGSLPDLYALIVEENHLEARNADDWKFLDALANCSKLNWLSLHSNKFRGVLPRSVANLSSTLEKFYLQNNQIAGDVPASIGNLVGLTSLSMGNNFLSGTIPSVLGRIPMLQTLELGGNFFTGRMPTTLGNLTMLNLLDLGVNRLQGSIAPSLQNCTLEGLYLQSNMFTGTLPKEILSIPTLTRHLNLSDNSLTGSIPSEVGNLKNIQGLYVSNNRLTGEIPGAIGECQVLQYLHMQGNFLEGTIPASLNQLKGLQELNLSHNNLSGHVPDFFESLHNLIYLDLSYNNLDGEVPKDGVFRNATAFSVLGNNRLCGGVPEANLPPCSSRKERLLPKVMVIVLITGGVSCFIILVSISAAHYLPHKSMGKPSDSNRGGLAEHYHQVSFSRLLGATDDFSPANLIGVGSFGSVYKGIMDWEYSKNIAVKVFDLRQDGALTSFEAECMALRNTRHRNIVKILTTCSGVDFRGNDFKALVFELFDNGSLDQWLHREATEQGAGRGRILSFIDRLNISIDVASALSYLHNHGPTPIVHCDLKPSNVLLDHGMVAHVGDFGLSRFLDGTATVSESSLMSTSTAILRGTIGYAAPEYGITGEVSTQGDEYSFGILLLEMFTGKRPTDEIFDKGMNLRRYVEMALPERVAEIVDPEIVSLGIEKEASSSDSLADGSAEHSPQCMSSVLRIALSCSEVSPKERMDMERVVAELNKAKEAYLKTAATIYECRK